MDTILFRCKRSGKTVAFKQEHDILAMRREPGYEEVTQCNDSIRAIPENIVATPAKRGRPRKG